MTKTRVKKNVRYQLTTDTLQEVDQLLSVHQRGLDVVRDREPSKALSFFDQMLKLCASRLRIGQGHRLFQALVQYLRQRIEQILRMVFPEPEYLVR